LLAWLRPRRPCPSEHQRALDLLAAVDAGGVPLNPARVNQIARQLGLEVSTHAPVEHTIARIRAAMERQR
jgi:energy-converting hydrogenase Eha subunit F